METSTFEAVNCEPLKCEPVKSPAPAFHSYRLLVADDDVPLSQFLRRGLQSEHNGVDVVNDGETALQALSQTRYSLLILDLNLPKRDGMSVLLRSFPRRITNSRCATGIASTSQRLQSWDGY